MNPLVPSVFDELEARKPLAYASTGIRFLNLLIDTAAYYVLTIVSAIIASVLSYSLHMDLVSYLDGNTLSDKAFTYLHTYIIWFLYYFLFEALSKGRTLGKLLTRTYAVKEDGSPITVKDAARRSLARLVPFEQFTGFSGYPLHDKWSKLT